MIQTTGSRARKLHAVVNKLAAEKLGKMAAKSGNGSSSPSPSPPTVRARVPGDIMSPLLPGLNPALHGSFFYHGLPTQVGSFSYFVKRWYYSMQY